MSLQRLLAPLVEVRKEEGLTALMMFSYSFLAMTAYNAIKPLTRSKFISDLGADNLPYVLLAAGFIIGILMTGYAWLMARLPKRWAIPATQVGMAGMLLLFWFLFQTSGAWVSIGSHTRRSPHQSVLDPGESRLRPAAGEAAVRVRRRRRSPRRRRRVGAGVVRQGDWVNQSAATKRAADGHLRRARHTHHRPGKAGR
jgi:hypothetical protein